MNQLALRPGRRQAISFLVSLATFVALLIPTSAIAAVGEIRPFEVQGYKQDFGVSDQAAERNLITQQQGAGIVAELEAVQGEDFAGVWFDNGAGEFVVPVIAEAKRDRVQDALAGANVEDSARTKPAQYTWEELEAAQEQLDEELQGLLEGGLIRTSLDPRTNAVVVQLANGASKSQQGQLDRSVANSAVKVEVRVTDADLVKIGNTSCQFEFKRCTAPLRGGVGIKKGGGCGPECTAAFKATGNQFGNRFMLTAGHCIVLGGIYKWYAELPNNEAPAIGLAEGVTYPGGDWAAINANGSYWDNAGPWPSQVAFWNQGTPAQETSITAESGSYMGQLVCHSGLTTGGHCGPVAALNVTGQSSGGLQYHLAMFGPTCIDEGDSGGPVFAGNVALGIVSARVLPPQGCGSDYGLYPEITEATDALGVSVGPRLGTVPYGESEPPTSVSGTSAIFNGFVNPHGIATNYHFQYGPTSAYGSATQLWGAGSGWQTIPVSGQVSNLEPLSGYHYRLVAQNAAGTAYGVDEEFSTPSAPPIVVTEPATSVEQREVTLRGTVNPRGASTNYNFEYGETTSYGTSVPIPSENVGSGRVAVAKSQLVKGLQPGETYHYRIKATNSFGETSYGGDQQFKMKPAPPDVTTKPATSVTETSAVVNGTLNPNGAETTYYFEYGPTTAYGSKTPAVNMGTGTKFVDKAELLEALPQSPHAFHFRIRATNSLGTTLGSDLTFNPGWKAKELATPEGSKASGMADVSCSTAAACTAVGYRTLTAGGTVPRVERWNGTVWTTQTAPAVEGSKGSPLTGVSCATATACTAVGSFSNSPEVTTAFAERWNGSKWEIQSTPIPAGAKSTSLQAISCISANSCIAVGSQTNPYSLPHALRWDGSSWSLLTVPVPENSAVSWFSGVSCTSGTACTAVGTYLDNLLLWHTLVMRWDGTKWEIAPSPIPAKSLVSELASVSCTTATECTAVGTYVNEKEVWLPMAMRWNGTTWSLQEVPAPTGVRAEFSGVSCASATACIATGFSTTSSGTKVSLAERWDGTTWEVHGTPNPEGAKSTTLRGIDCTTSNDCQVAGQWENGAGMNALIESYRRTSAPTAITKAATNLTQSGVTLNGGANPNGLATSYFFEYGPTTSYGSKTAEVAIGSGSSAVAASTAVGGLEPGITYHYRLGAKSSAGTSFGIDQAFTTTNPTWTLQTAPAPEGASNGTFFKGISCPSESACTAVGFSLVSKETAAMLVERWNGTKWEIQTTPSIAGAKESRLESVSCPSATSCIAAGSYKNSSSNTVLLALKWDGTKWEVMSVPTPENAILSGLSGISCSSVNSCVAVGYIFDFGFTQKSLAMHWDGTKWEIRSSPNPSGSSVSYLWGVSCTSATACTAVGSYLKNDVTTTAQAMRWNGASWALQSIPVMEGEKESELRSVSCSAATACTAAGFFKNSGGAKVALVDSWNGSAWSGQSPPSPPGAKEAALWSVSCPSTTTCAGVGYYKNSSGITVTLAERWNGTKWSVHTTPNPEGAKSASLSAVACNTTVTCEAGGTYESGTGSKLPLAMGY